MEPSWSRYDPRFHLGGGLASSSCLGETLTGSWGEDARTLAVLEVLLSSPESSLEESESDSESEPEPEEEELTGDIGPTGFGGRSIIGAITGVFNLEKKTINFIQKNQV